LLNSLVPLAALAGSLMGAPITKLGRKTGIIITDIISVIGVAVCLLSIQFTTMWIFYAGRIIVGIGVGLNSTVTPLYLKEIAPISMSGTTGTMY